MMLGNPARGLGLAACAMLVAACGGGGGAGDADGGPDAPADVDAAADSVADDGGTGDGVDGPGDAPDPDAPDADAPDVSEGLDGDTAETDAPDAGDPCDGVACSGHGRCVAVDDAPTCACAAGFYMVALDCLRDPCETGGGTCYYVDADGGLDANPGTRALPWRTLGRVEDARDVLGPGDYVLFQRGDSWADTAAFVIRDVTGEPERPVTFGAYDEGPRPQLRAIGVVRSAHVTLRDLESVGSDRGPCVNVSESEHVIVQDLHAHQCQNNGLHFGEASSYGVLIDNLVWDVLGNDALVVHSPTVVTEETEVGDHFWIVDNRVPGDVGEQPVDVATGTDDVAGSRDFKVVGNLLTGGNNGCVALGHGTSVVWVVGNLLGNCTSVETAFALGVGGQHGANSGTDYEVSGNVIFHNLMPSLEVAGEPPAVPRVWFHHNTVVQGTIGRRSSVRSAVEMALSFDHNVVWATGTNAHVQLRAAADVVAMDDNWFVPDGLPECRIFGQSLADWSAATGFDAASRCAAVPGLELPTEAELLDFDAWSTPGFLAHFVPDAGWAGCAAEVGAVGCDGTRRVEFRPIPDYPDNGGLGWEGPLVVRQRYRLRD